MLDRTEPARFVMLGGFITAYTCCAIHENSFSDESHMPPRHPVSVKKRSEQDPDATWR